MTNIQTLAATSATAVEVLRELRASTQKISGNQDLTLQAKQRRLAEAQQKAQTAIADLRTRAEAAYRAQTDRIQDKAAHAVPEPAGIDAVAAELRGTRAWLRARDRMESPGQDRIATATRVIQEADLPTLQVLREEMTSYFAARGMPGDAVQGLLDQRAKQLVPALSEAEEAQHALDWGYLGVLQHNLSSADEEARGGIRVTALHSWPADKGASPERLPVDPEKEVGSRLGVTVG